ncbi:MAG: hypothetical protein L0Y44_11465 [Phycisphaerales bacterium]|nr:hypothetical protein [Phycisphaerales bacterium]MCI0631258.1 hypothetical protein [Phycisphaerales bacterium]
MAQNWHRTIIAAVAAILATTPAARATNYVSNPSFPTPCAYWSWDCPNNWSPVGVPGNGDSATIQNGHTIAVTDSEAITTLVVSGTGQLEIESGGVLRVTGSSPSVSVAPASGLAVLDGGRLVIETTMTLSGDGSVQVQDGGVLELNTESSTTLTLSAALVINGALRVTANNVAIVNNSTLTWDTAIVEIGPNSGSGTVTFTNQVTIRGDVTIKRNPVNASGVANFSNQGLVEAQDGTITLDSTLNSITDTTGNRWKVADSDATLRFNKTATGLVGHFLVGPGTLVIDAPVTTSGLFGFYNGASVDIIDDADSLNVTGTGGVGSGNHYLNGSNCTSASFPMTADQSCDG